MEEEFQQLAICDDSARFGHHVEEDPLELTIFDEDDGRKIRVAVHNSKTVKELKQMYAERKGYETEDYVLAYRERLLDDDSKSLESLEIESGHRISARMTHRGLQKTVVFIKVLNENDVVVARGGLYGNKTLDLFKANFCEEHNRGLGFFRFLYQGREIEDNDTPYELGMSNGAHVIVRNARESRANQRKKHPVE